MATLQIGDGSAKGGKVRAQKIKKKFKVGQTVYVQTGGGVSLNVHKAKVMYLIPAGELYNGYGGKKRWVGEGHRANDDRVVCKFSDGKEHGAYGYEYEFFTDSVFATKREAVDNAIEYAEHQISDITLHVEKLRAML